MSRTSPSRTHLKRRVDDYLWRNQDLPMRRLREVLQSQFLPLGQVAVIGGLVRDIARKGPRGFKSDVDLVLDVAPRKVDKLAVKLGAVRNRFGGYGLRTPLWKIDFWALRNTWAHKEGHAYINSLDHLPRATFFNVDAIVYVLNERRLVADDAYIDQLLSRLLEINLLPNPSVEGNLVRAIRRILGWNMRAGCRLQEFIQDNLSDTMLERVKAVEHSLYMYSYATAFHDRDELLEALCSPRKRKAAHREAGLQYTLPFNFR